MSQAPEAAKPEEGLAGGETAGDGVPGIGCPGPETGSLTWIQLGHPDSRLVPVEGARYLRQGDVVVLDAALRVVALNHASAGCQLLEVGVDIPPEGLLDQMAAWAASGRKVVRLELDAGAGTDAERAASGLSAPAWAARRDHFPFPWRWVPGVARDRWMQVDSTSAPLAGCRVLVTRAREQADSISQLVVSLGGEPVEFPVVRIAPLDDYRCLDEALDRIEAGAAAGQVAFDWAIFTSANGVRALMGRLRERGGDIRSWKGIRLAAIGPATASALAGFGLKVDLVPREYVGEAVVEALKAREGSLAGKRVLLVRALKARAVIPEQLRELGATVVVAPAYQTLGDGRGAHLVCRLLEEGALHVLTFTSPSTVSYFCRQVAEAAGLALPSVGELIRRVGSLVACIGPITAEAAEEEGLPVHVVANQYTVPGLVQAVKDAWLQRSRERPSTEEEVP